MYESPIAIIEQKILNERKKQLQNALMYEIRMNYQIDVEEDELIRALQYDREQYEKGYQDGKTAMKKTGKWLINSDGYYPYCSQCKYEPKEMTRYCPNCGTEMSGDI
jgi:hypothetical protein